MRVGANGLVGPPHPPDALAALHFRDAVLKIGSVMAELAPKPTPGAMIAAANGADDGQPMGSPDGTRAIPEIFLQGGRRFCRKKKPRANKLCVFYRRQVQAICANLIAR